MLVSLLPGLRDLRTPLATGYLWVVGLWLILHDRVPKSVEQATGPIRSLYELSDLHGATVTLAALTFVTYLLGSTPNTYRLNYGDEQGNPSSLLTFFPGPGSSPRACVTPIVTRTGVY